jgi:hypothetical protein
MLSFQLSLKKTRSRVKSMLSGPVPSVQNVDGVDPSLIPHRILSSSAEMPPIGLDTFGLNDLSHGAVAQALRYTASIGYRHYGSASVYRTGERSGNAFGQRLERGLQREYRISGIGVYNDWRPVSGSSVTSTCLKKELVDRLVRSSLHPEDIVAHRFTPDRFPGAYTFTTFGLSGKVALGRVGE